MPRTTAGSPVPPRSLATMVREKNPYAASLAASSAASASVKKPDKPKQRDTVLSRVAKKAPVSKPPVRFCMTPRYRFALPDPPADLKVLRGPLAPDGAAAARVASRLELDARKTLVPADPSFGLRPDLVAPAQYAHRRDDMELLPEDQIALAAAQPSALGGAGRPGVSGATGASRSALPAKRAKAETAFPWMRRMSYDEYAPELRRDGERKPPATTAGAGVAAMKAKAAQEQLRKERVRAFDLAKVRVTQIRHPDSNKRALRAVSSVPVFPDMTDWSTDLISLQFDRQPPLEGASRFATDKARGEAALEAAVSISVSDDDDKKFLSVFAPDEQSLDEIAGKADAEQRAGEEYHELLREYHIRDAGLESKAGARAKKRFLVRSEGEGKDEVVGLTRVPNAWLMTPRQAILKPLARSALELEREPFTQDLKRRRLEKVVNELTGK